MANSDYSTIHMQLRQIQYSQCQVQVQLFLKKSLIFFIPLISTFFNSLTPLLSPAFFLFSSSFFLFFSALASAASSSSSRARLMEKLLKECVARACCRREERQVRCVS